MPRVTDVPPNPAVARAPAGEVATPAAPVAPAEVSGTPNTSSVRDSFDGNVATAATSGPFEAYFTPYDPAAKAELALLDRVVDARRADPTEYPPGESPYSIHYAVYNLRSPAVINRMIEASRAGVDVQVLIESKQIAPDRTWNKVDDMFAEAGLKVVHEDIDLPLAEREAAHLVGIHSNHLMHLKARIFSYKDPETGDVKTAALSGSMNPGDGAAKNDENLNLIEDPSIVRLYEKKFDDVLAHRRTDNVWNVERGLNVLFTPCKTGPRPIEKVFEWIDQEQEMILLSIFDLNNITDPASRKTLVEKLGEAKDRGVLVAAITDRKKSDGLDAEGNRVEMYGHFASNDWTDEDLERLDIPVYEFTNESGNFNAMHPKAAIFGLSDMKVITGAGNWTRAGIGNANKRARNEESFIFVESGKLDNNRTGRRYLSNFLYLLREYDHQNTEHAPAEEMIRRLQALPGWPEVEVDPTTLVPAGHEGEAWLTGPHPALTGRDGEPGLGISTSSTPLGTMTRPRLELPFGTLLEYDVVTDPTEGSPTTPDGHTPEHRVVVIAPGDGPRMPELGGD